MHPTYGRTRQRQAEAATQRARVGGDGTGATPKPSIQQHHRRVLRARDHASPSVRDAAAVAWCCTTCPRWRRRRPPAVSVKCAAHLHVRLRLCFPRSRTACAVSPSRRTTWLCGGSGSRPGTRRSRCGPLPSLRCLQSLPANDDAVNGEISRWRRGRSRYDLARFF